MADIKDSLNYYERLKIEETAYQDEISKTHHYLAKRYHPDFVPGHMKKLKKETEEK